MTPLKSLSLACALFLFKHHQVLHCYLELFFTATGLIPDQSLRDIRIHASIRRQARSHRINHFVINGFPLLSLAVMTGNVQYIESLLTFFPHLDPNTQQIRTKQTALMHAAKQPYGTCIETLHKHFPSINPNLQDICGLTALSLAIVEDSMESMTTLCRCFPSIDPNIPDNAGWTPLLFAAASDSSKYIELLQRFFNTKIHVDATTSNGDSALIQAVCNYINTQQIETLYRCFPNIDPNIQSTSGWTALLMSASCGNRNNYSILHQCFPSINPSLQNWRGQTALMLFIANRPLELIQFYEAFPTSQLNLQDDAGWTVLMYAVDSTNLQTLQTVLAIIQSNNHLDQY